MPLWQALEHRDFRLLYVGQTVSFLGDMIFHVALTWQVVELGGSAAELGLVLGAYMAAQVALLLVGGVVVDRFRRRDLLFASDLAQGILVALLAWLAASGALTFPLLLAFAALFGAAAAIAMPALGALLPETVPATALASANALHQGARSVAMVAGPALGGVLVAYAGTPAAFAADAATFAASLVLLAWTRGAPAPGPREGGLLADLAGGIRYVLGVPWLWITILLFAVLNVGEAGPRNVVLPILVAEGLRLEAGAFGLVLAVSAAGSLVALALVGSRPPGAARRGAVAFGCVVVAGIAFALTGFATSLAALLVLSFLKSAAYAPFGLLWETALGDSVDPRLRGRVLSLDMLGSFALLPFAMGATGAFAAALGPAVTFLAGGLLMVACGIVGLLAPAARAFR